MAKKRAAEKTGKVSFEKNLEQLEQIVAQLEGGELSLDKALEQYEAGVQRLRSCHQALERAERRIEVLAGVRADGTPVAQPLDDRETSVEEKQATRSARRSTDLPSDVDESQSLF